MRFIYFISDVHLGFGSSDEEKIKEQRLLALFDEIALRGNHLYIVGDLFDFWFEYQTVLPKGYHRILTALQNLVEQGITINYLAGNHDFAIGKYFERELRISVSQNEHRVVWNKKKFYLYHGDGLAPGDGGYRIVKKILRNRLSQWCFRWIHPDIGVRIARFFSHTSRDYTSAKNYGEVDGMSVEAEKIINQGYDFVIMGHQHAPRIERIGRGTYVNLGDWIHHFTYAIFDGTDIHLRSIKEEYQLETTLSV